MAADADEWEICNDDGFVYKRRRRLHPSSPSAAPNPPPSLLLQRRRHALLRLRSKYLLELARWDSLSSSLLSPLPPTHTSPPPPAPTTTTTHAPTSSDLALVDDLLAQAEAQEVALKKLSEMCDEINSICDAHEGALVDAVTSLPIWGSPRELVSSLQS